MSDLKMQAVLDYGERLKTRSENDILYQKITTFWHIQIRNIIIILIVLYYFRNLISENGIKQPEYTPYIQQDQPEIENFYTSNNMRFLTCK